VLLDKYGHRFKAGEQSVEDAEAYFARHGNKTLVMARFAPGIKSFAPLLAGVTRMNFALFQAWNVGGAVFYALVMVGLGYFFGSNLPLLLKIVQRLGWAVLFVVAALAALWVWERRRVIERRRERERVHEDDGAAEDRPDDADA
jgi:membrane-associated protein